MKTDYGKLIDSETWAFIERTNSYYPPDTAGYSIEQQRAVYDRMCAAFHAGRPAGVTVDDGMMDGVLARRYRAGGESDVTVAYFHGGGFVVGGLDSHDDVCAEICARTGYTVVSADYRLSPEHPHPAAFEDALTVARQASRMSSKLVLAGDSAGGNLAAAASAALRGELTPMGQVLIYPGLGGDRSRGSYVAHAEAPMLTAADVDFYSGIRTGGAERKGDPTLAPLHDSDFSALPPTVVFSAQCDPLCDDGRDYRDALVAAGGRAVWLEEQGLVHGYLRARHSVARARDSFERIVAAVSALGQGRWPWQ